MKTAVASETRNSSRSAPTQGFFALNGHQIFCREAGDGEPALLLHGFPDHAGNLLRLFDAMAQTHRIVAYDRLGSGRSDKPDLPYGFDWFSDELDQVINAKFPNEKVTLVAHSIGGAVATHYAARHPEKVRALVMLNPALCDFHIQTGMNYLGAWFLEKPLVGEVMMMFQSKLATQMSLTLAFYNKKRMTRDMVESYHFPFLTPGGKRSYLRAMRSIYRQKDGAVLEDIQTIQERHIPALLVWTEKDWSMPVLDGYRFAELFGGKLVTVPNCGHSPHLELDPEPFERAVMQPIRKFLQNL